MKLSKIVLVLVFLSMSSFLKSQNNTMYSKLWKNVENFEKESLPKSAATVVDEILTKSLTEKNIQQTIKAVLYKTKYSTIIQEKGIDSSILFVEKLALESKGEQKAILHFVLAGYYWQIYQNERWQIVGRTALNSTPEDFNTWTNRDFALKIHREYKLCFEESDILKSISLEKYTLLATQSTMKKDFMPTVYDFLVNEAIHFYRNSQMELSTPKEEFSLNKEIYFSDIEDFVNYKIETEDTLSFLFHSVLLFQDLLRFRLSDKENENALLYFDLSRISFVKNKSKLENSTDLYKQALNQYINKYPELPYKSMAYFKLAELLNNQAENYSAFNENLAIYKDYSIKADSLCNFIIEKYPNSRGADFAQSLKDQLRTKTLSFNLEQIVSPKSKFPIKIDYRNIEKIYIRVASIKESELNNLHKKYYSDKLYERLLKTAIKVKDYEVNIPVDSDFRAHSFEYILDSLSLGNYIVFVANNPKFDFHKSLTSYQSLIVSNLSYFIQNVDNKTIHLSVLDRNSGQGKSNVVINAYSEDYDYKKSKYVKVNLGRFETDKKGQVLFVYNKKHNKSVYFDFNFKNDKLSTYSNYYVNGVPEPKTPNISTHLFTDRAIYRPGQIVYFKGIMISSDGETNQILTNNSDKVYLLDFNGQNHGELKVKTNEYGTFSGQFVLPQGQLNGKFILESSYGSVGISVEEYKRPKFEVEILPFTKNYTLEQDVSVSGKATAYSGAAISEAKVVYNITRQPVWSGWWWWNVPSAPTQMANGVLETKDDGTFELSFKAIPDPNMAKSEYLSFNYMITVDITDLTGETHSISKSIRVGYRALMLDFDIDAEIDLADFDQNKKIEVITKNLNNEPIKASGEIHISRLKEAEYPYRERYWTRPDKHFYTKEEWQKVFPGNPYNNENELIAREKDTEVFSEKFNTANNKYITLKSITSFKTGNYVVEMTANDAFGKRVYQKKYFSVSQSNSLNIPYKENFYVKELNVYGEPGDTAAILVGTAYENAELNISIEHKGKIIHNEIRYLNSEQQIVEWPIKEEYRGNFGFHIAMIKENREYSESVLVTVPYTNKKLDIEFLSFRDKLQPGEKEQWQIKIKGQIGEKVAAEMMATLYDASLDQFKSHSWLFNIYRSYYLNNGYRTHYFGFQSSNNLARGINKIHSIPNLYFSRFNWYGSLNYLYRNSFFGYQNAGLDEVVVSETSRKRLMPRAKKTMAVNKADFSDEESTIEMDKPEPPSPAVEKIVENDPFEEASESENSNAVQVRTNFNETAFFYPHLHTDAEGNIIIKFTIPESLTKWKMLGLATTKDLKFGQISESLITQKELMVVPNSPRFFREGDIIVFPSKITNLSKEAQSGEISLELFDATTNQSISIFSKGEKASQKFDLESGKNGLVTWKLKIPEGISAVRYKVIAKSKQFSDGEQKALPVLSNRMLVTESMPLSIRGHQQKEFVFEKLIHSNSSKTLLNHKLTLEFSSNPAWYAIQALPYLMEYPFECNEQTFNRFYANSLATHIANSSPKIKSVFDSWKNTPNSKALLSNLEKNQELKAVLLQETPWVLEGKNESERKQRLAFLFDLNRMTSENERALQKLIDAQGGNGGFAWFKGMPENWFITQYIVSGLGHLNKLGVITSNNRKLYKMQSSAINYIDHKMKGYYDDIKRNTSLIKMSDNHLSYMIIHYLYARSFFEKQNLYSNNQEAFDYFKGQAKKYWKSQNLYMRALIALSLNRFGEKTEAIKIMASIKEHAINNEELGMYWKDNESGYYWYQAPIETQAVLIEAFSEITKDNHAIEEMKIWLLKQKQTQDWKTTKATADAIYALILQGTDVLESNSLVEIKLGNEIIDPMKSTETKVEAGTGYFKTSWSKTEIKPKMGNVSLKKDDDGIAWGSLYWQYFEDLDKITSHETPLKLKKELFIEKQTNQSKVLEPVKNNVQIGDKIVVRIELRVDRDMEYVHMKDMRASGFEPENVISRYKYQDGLGYYEVTKDASTNFFFDYLPKGTYVFEYSLRAVQQGEFSNGITQIQSMYAPEFMSHSKGIRVKINK